MPVPRVTFFEARIVEVPAAPLDGNTSSGGVWSSGEGGVYRYGFNGKENDNSTGEGNLDFGARILDVRLARWLSVDPSWRKYPNETPYMYSGDNAVIFADPDGKDRILRIYAIVNDNKTFLGTITYKELT